MRACSRRVALGILATLAVGGCRKHVEVTPQPSREGLAGATGVTTTTAASSDEDGQWTMPTKNYANTRYSRLARITTANVKDLRLVWSYGRASSEDTKPRRSWSATRSTSSRRTPTSSSPST